MLLLNIFNFCLLVKLTEIDAIICVNPAILLFASTRCVNREFIVCAMLTKG